MLIGYARASWRSATLDAQADQLHAAGVARRYIYQDPAGREEQAAEMLQALRPGDLVLVTTLDRLSPRRSLLVRLSRILVARACLRTLDGLEVTDAQAPLLAGLTAAAKVYDRERTEPARRVRGRPPGRKRKLSGRNLDMARRYWMDGTLTVAEVCELLAATSNPPVQVSPSTLYAAAAEHGWGRRPPAREAA
ncbi:MAG TPA: recombinase family protein [Azospirillaceae bacterium]|nr:recombinase family protein [Azospirillaceae bacterium]